jgi:hypothetical protein
MFQLRRCQKPASLAGVLSGMAWSGKKTGLYGLEPLRTSSLRSGDGKAEAYLPLHRPSDIAAQQFAKKLGVVWSGVPMRSHQNCSIARSYLPQSVHLSPLP